MHTTTMDSVSLNMMTLIDEATETHGKVLRVGFENFPQVVKEQIYAEMEQAGYDRKKVDAMMASIAMQKTKSETLEADIMSRGISSSGDDVVMGAIQHTIESYDKDRDERILHSEDLVKAYNEMIKADFDRAYSYTETYMNYMDRAKRGSKNAKEMISKIDKHTDKNGPQGSTGLLALISACDPKEAMEQYKLSKADIQKMICEAAYQPTDDDPEKIKAIINARIKYNNTIIQMFKEMLSVNYAILGMSKEEAAMLSAKLNSNNQKEVKQSVSEIKAAIKANESKFRTGNRWDLRPLGLGVMFMTDEDVGGIAKDVSIDRMVQILSQYDCVVVGHGSDRDPKSDAYIKRKRDENDKVIKAYKEKIDNEKVKIVNQHQKEYEQLHNAESIERETLKKKVDVKKDEISKRYDALKREMNADIKKYQQEINKAFDQLINHEITKDEYEKISKEYQDIIEDLQKKRSKALDDYFDNLDKINQEYYDLCNKQGLNNNDYRKIDAKRADAMDKLRNEYEKFIDELEKETIFRYYRIHQRYIGESRWGIQPVKTLSGGPFTDVNDLVRQLIKEGFKKINLVSCNPGGHQLDKDIRDKDGIEIHYATRSLLSESAEIVSDDDYSYEAIEAGIMNTHCHLMETCEQYGINYLNDTSLNEAAMGYVNLSTNQTLTEGVLSTVWEGIKKLIAKAIGFIASIVKKILGLIKRVIDKIKEFFSKILGSNRYESRFSQKLNTGAIMVESARMDKYSAGSWEDLQKKTLAACGAIQKKIDILERKNVENLKEIDRYADKMTKTVHESVEGGNLSGDQLNKLLLQLW